MCDVDYNVELNVENKSVSKSNKILICQKCNIEFIKRKHKTQKFCSLKCSSDSRKREHKKLLCPNCSMEFVETSIRQKYCSFKCVNEFQKGKSKIRRGSFFFLIDLYCKIFINVIKNVTH